MIVEGDFLHHMADKHRARDAAGKQTTFHSDRTVTVLAYQGKVEEDKPQSPDDIIEYFAVDSKTNRCVLVCFDSFLQVVDVV